MTTSCRREFLCQTALFNAIGAAFQHAAIYKRVAGANAKDDLKRDLEDKLRKLERRYRNPVSSQQHCANIAKLAREMSCKHALTHPVSWEVACPSRECW